MRSFLLLYGDPSGGGFSGDPSELNPEEHYNETGWYGVAPNELRTDIVTGTPKWDTESGSRTPTTQNGLKVQETASGGWTSNTTPKSIASWLNTDVGITMFFVTRWDGGDNDTLHWWSGDVANEIFRQKSSGGYMYNHIRDAAANNLIISEGFLLRSGAWDVWAIRYQNLANDGKLECFHFQTAATSATAATWTVVNLNGVAVGQKLTNNDANSEPWDGAIAEMILFREALTDDQIQSINAFLTTKWGITAP